MTWAGRQVGSSLSNSTITFSTACQIREAAGWGGGGGGVEVAVVVAAALLPSTDGGQVEPQLQRELYNRDHRDRRYGARACSVSRGYRYRRHRRSGAPAA